MSSPASSLQTTIQRDYHVVFTGKGVKDLSSVEEILVADRHGLINDVETNMQAALDSQALVSEGDISFIEGQRSFTSIKGIIKAALSALNIPAKDLDVARKRIETAESTTLGWDYIEGAGDSVTEVPNYWKCYETVASIAEELHHYRPGMSYLYSAVQLERYKQLQTKYDFWNSRKETNPLILKAIENWSLRQDSLIKTLEVSSMLRKSGSEKLPQGVQLTGNYNIKAICKSKKSVFNVGASHLLKSVCYIDQIPGVDKVLAFLANRNAIIVVPKNSSIANRVSTEK